VNYLGNPGQEFKIAGQNALRAGSVIRLGNFGPIVFREQPDLSILVSSHVTGLPWTLGTENDNQLVLKGTGVFGYHAQINLQSGRYIVRDLSGGKTYVSYTGDPSAERQVSEVNAVRDGSTIRIGQFLLIFRVGQG
jgi:pSer/pThr/pTyr-binding forkhead associated (FHA) protein